MDQNKDYLKNFGMIIPLDVTRRDDGNPCVYARYKQEFIDYFKHSGHLEDLEKMSWTERDEEYLKWEKEFKTIDFQKLPIWKWENNENKR